MGTTEMNVMFMTRMTIDAHLLQVIFTVYFCMILYFAFLCPNSPYKKRTLLGNFRLDSSRMWYCITLSKQ